MSQVSPQIKIFALVGLLAALALGGGMFVLSHQAAARAAEPAPAIQPKLAKALATPQAQPATPKPAKPAAKPAPKPKPVAPPKARFELVEGLPVSLAAALQQSRVVVVALYSPEAPLDELALKEVESGARAAGAGFVALDVLQQADVGELVKQFGVMSAPATLIYRRPGTVATRMDGFVDRTTVEQAASSTT